MPEFDWVITALMIGGVVAFVMGTCAYLVLAERKVAAWVQDRYGPNRVGPWGLLQPIVDGGKMFFKEDVIPSHVDRIFFVMAPIMSFATALTAIAVVPVGPALAPPAPQTTLSAYESAQETYQESAKYVIQPGIDIGFLYVFAIGSLAVYGIILAGWSANNKFSLLGCLRSSAQIISYEIPLGMALVGVLLYAGSLNLETIVHWQVEHSWFVFSQPLAFLIFMIAVFAECNRLPFDLPEAEQELVGGYHTEYSNSMKLGLMLLAEYAHMITVSFMMALIFWGGWSFFGLENLSDDIVVATLIKFAILGVKMFAFIMLFLLVRWTIPRFRFDQLMALAWKVVIPLSIAHLFAVMLVREFALPLIVLTMLSLGLFVFAGVMTVWFGKSNNAPKRLRHPLPRGLQPGVTFAGR